MEEHQFDPRPCPDCQQPTRFVKLGNEAPREVCGRFGCDWDGITLRRPTPVREDASAGILIE